MKENCYEQYAEFICLFFSSHLRVPKIRNAQQAVLFATVRRN